MIDPTEKHWQEYREKNKHLNFWQALRDFSGVDKITVTYNSQEHDTEHYQDVDLHRFIK